MKIITAIAITLIATTGAAVGQQKTEEMCPSIGELAAVVMTIRQDGVPMSTAMGVVRGADAALVDVATIMVKSAYGSPQFSMMKTNRRPLPSSATSSSTPATPATIKAAKCVRSLLQSALLCCWCR